MNPRQLFALTHPLERPTDDTAHLMTKTIDPNGNLLQATLAVDR